MSGCPDGGSRVGPEDDPDRYVVGPPVAAGAEGILFRGSTARAGVEVEVAIKMLQPRFLPRVDEWHAMWDDQVHLLRSLQTPGVVGVREGFLGSLPHPPGQVGDSRTLYLVMNWVDGERLDEWVRRRPDRDPFEALNLLLGVATALDLMHSGHFTRAPVVHRDVKPANILVTDQGTVLVDFGLTRALPDGPRLSGVTGTLGYLAPEATGLGVYTPATDRYAMGAVAYFVFTGAEPPERYRPDALRAALAAVPALVDRPEAVDHLMAMLDSDPEVRPCPLSNWVGQVRRSTLGDSGGPPPADPVPVGSPTGPSVDPEAFRDALSALAQALVTLEGSGDLAFVRQLAGAGSDEALRISAVVDQVWLRYPVVKEVGDELAAGGASSDAAAHLLDTAVTLPTGATTTPPALVAELARQAEEAAARAAGLARTALEALSSVEAAEVTLGDLRRRVDALGAAADPEVAGAFRSVADAQSALARDLSPSSATGDLERALARARRGVDHLEDLQKALPGRLMEARARLEDIETLITEGAEAFASAVEKVRQPAGLRAPLEPSCLEGGERALRSWLDRIAGDVRAGRWRAAGEGLDGWTHAAAALHVEAAGIREANEGPVAVRNELRGLLGVYRTMAGSMGMAEDKLLGRLHADASDALYVAPCDLDAADRKVRAYIDAVNRQPQDERR